MVERSVLSIPFFFRNGSGGYLIDVALCADGFLAFGLIYLIFALCTMSELVVVSVRELEDFITNIHLNTNPAQQQIMICNSLSKFRGFDANGYFTLNHSMLTGMIASIVTYLVVLVQFRQSGV